MRIKYTGPQCLLGVILNKIKYWLDKLKTYYLLFKYGCYVCQNEKGWVDYRRRCQYHTSILFSGEIGRIDGGVQNELWKN